ncbi:c-type cytochrome [Alcaligenaceae bacterium SJ-26]|nr:c-type cytochrome [Alcaligenaceae bacterium SJ-26]
MESIMKAHLPALTPIRLLGLLFASAATIGTLAAHAADQATPRPEPVPFVAPRNSDMPAGPEGELIDYGRRLMVETRRLLPNNVGAAMNCTSCHLGEAKVPFASPFVGISHRFPQYNPRANRIVTLEDRVNGCMMRSMNGKPLDKSSREMAAMIAYMDWLSEDIPEHGLVQGMGIGKVDTTLVPDMENGRRIYVAQCASCHGAEGQGLQDAAGEFIFPPLWGDLSFNIGAGMARLYKAAEFVKTSMPVGVHTDGRLGQGYVLSDQEAVDVAGYFTHQPRPDFPAKVNDWPDPSKRPKDARY